MNSLTQWLAGGNPNISRRKVGEDLAKAATTISLVGVIPTEVKAEVKVDFLDIDSWVKAMLPKGSEMFFQESLYKGSMDSFNNSAIPIIQEHILGRFGKEVSERDFKNEGNFVRSNSDSPKDSFAYSVEKTGDITYKFEYARVFDIKGEEFKVLYEVKTRLDEKGKHVPTRILTSVYKNGDPFKDQIYFSYSDFIDGYFIPAPPGFDRSMGFESSVQINMSEENITKIHFCFILSCLDLLLTKV